MTACAVFTAPAVDSVLVATARVGAVAAVLILGRSSILELVPLEVCVALFESSSSKLVACRVDERLGRPPAESEALALVDRAVPAALLAPAVGVATICTLALVEPHT